MYAPMMNRKIIDPPRFPMIIAMLIDEDVDGDAEEDAGKDARANTEMKY